MQAHLKDELTHLLEAELKPRTLLIDQQGEYPARLLRRICRLGVLEPLRSPGPVDLEPICSALELISGYCLTTGFLLWSQASCAWYLHCADNDDVRQRYLDSLIDGDMLAGSGIANALKSGCGLEPMALRGFSHGDGYRIGGTLPWVSNLAPNNLICCIFNEATEDQLHMALIPCRSPGLHLQTAPRFMALDGSATFSVRFDQVPVQADQLISSDLDRFLPRIKPGLLLLQSALGAGLARSCLQLAQKRGQQSGNCHLPEQPEPLLEELAVLVQQRQALCQNLCEGSFSAVGALLELRLACGRLALDAAQCALLHSGASGFIQASPIQRKLREACFFTIVTPSIKQLHTELANRA